MRLADTFRPQSLEEFIGQEHLVAPGQLLHQLINQDQIPSLIFWGPPGTGKTTLARIIARQTKMKFVALSAVFSGVKDIREIVQQAQHRQTVTNWATKSLDLFQANEPTSASEVTNTGTMLFIDEIHRFNKAQQDALLPHVEDGTLTLIGATTENPSFEVNAALLSRCRVVVFNQLTPEHIITLLKRVLADTAHGYGKQSIEIADQTLTALAKASHGDARTALNVLEIAVNLASSLTNDQSLLFNHQEARMSSPLKNSKDKFQISSNAKLIIHEAHLKAALQNTHLLYDRAGDEHYNTISAFIKSMRASQPDAALYYLARMVEAGEDPKFIARRMVIFASEDIGLANPNALLMANEVFRTCETIGYPECPINLAHGVVYLAQSAKDRRAYDALRAAQADVQQHGNLPIPKEILNAPTELMKNLDYGKGYEKYTSKSFLPEKLKTKKYFSTD